MGITWIIGVLVVEVEELCPLAYIFTIFVAFQGVFIFVIFVLLSKQVSLRNLSVSE
jgi:latrophilin 2